MTSGRFLHLLLALFAAGTLLSACAPSGPRGPVVFAASSLQLPLEQLAADWVKEGGEAPVFSFASSTALARQIENGSFADIYISADPQWTDYIITAGRIDAQNVNNLASNQIVLATHRDGKHAADYVDMPSTKQLLTDVSLASGDPDSVPLGRYAKEMLVSEGIWDDVSTQLIRAQSSSAALRLVLLKEADFGILYKSDVTRRDDLVSYPTFKQDAYSPILYRALQLPSSGHPDAREFLDFIASAEAAAVFRKYGFEIP